MHMRSYQEAMASWNITSFKLKYEILVNSEHHTHTILGIHNDDLIFRKSLQRDGACAKRLGPACAPTKGELTVPPQLI